ncbi:phosphatase PAP2 family protein [Neptunomonas japonica]|uniref:undecaprenyl-diphosphate phosphatase n=1 Tax=Neptunomonas japonica JAMM 1380 TaxID=1441457 RepID=A0A7R6PLB5_9GAMM|nr:phosphatase PAP2 family protein [Neptunomonas japonica]BBB31236.1 phosphoesterase [Neptunomonas japonica JAMM 1380]
MLSIQTITAFDTSLFYWFQDRRQMHAGITTLSRNVSRLGDGVLYLLLGGLLALFEPQDGVSFLRLGLFAFVVELPLYLFLKNIIRRDRPCQRLDLKSVVTPLDKFGFPSGHAAAAFVFASVLAHVYPSVALLTYIIAILIGISRVVLGVHYPADIVAGAVVGIVCAKLCIGVVGG